MLVHILEGFDMSKVIAKVRNSLNLDRAAWSDAHGIEFKDPSLAVQSQRDEADINNIVKAFGVTGRLPENIRVPSYGDFDGISDYREAIEAVRAAEMSFMQLPSDLRERLDHSPQRFLEYCTDPANLEEMRKLGLAVSGPPVAPVSGGEPVAGKP